MLSYTVRRWLFFLSLPLLLAGTLWHLRVENDLNAFFTATDSEDSALLAGFLQSGELSRRYLILVEPKVGATAAGGAVASFGDRFVQQLSRLEKVERAWPANQPPKAWLDAIKAYAPHHEQIWSLDPQVEWQALFDSGQLQGRAAALQQLLISPQAEFIKPIALQDPLLLSLQGFRVRQRQFESLRQTDSNFSGLFLQSRAAALDAEAQSQLQSEIRKTFDFLNQAEGSVFALSFTGIPVFTVAAHGEISRDVTLVSFLSSVGVALVFLLLFRSFAALHWMLLIQGVSFAVGTLATRLVFGDVHSLTLALGATLMGICTDYPIHVLVHSAKHRAHAVEDAARLLWPSLLMGGLTTVIGYLALGSTGFPGLEQIAVFAIGGIAASLMLTRWILPALLQSTRLHPAHLPGIGTWIEYCQRRRKILLIGVAVSSLAAFALLPQIRWMEDLQNLAMDMGQLKQRDQAIRAKLTSVEPGRFVLIRGPDMETALQRAEAAERRMQKLQESGDLSEYHGLFPWLVSQGLQKENAEAYRQALSPEFLAAWREALQSAGLSVDKLGALQAAAGEPLLPEQVLLSEIRQILSGQIIDQDGRVALALWLGQHDPAVLEQALQGLEGVTYFSQRERVNRMAEQHRDRSLRMLGWGIALMAGLIWLQQRSVRKVCLTLLPALGAVLFIFASWALMGEEVSFLHVIGLLLSISLCVDYGIFFMDNRGQDAGITYHAIASSTLTTLASFGALALAKTPTLPILAISVTLGVTLGFLLCPLLIKAGGSSGKILSQ